jgi:hypothetical protein
MFECRSHGVNKGSGGLEGVVFAFVRVSPFMSSHEAGAETVSRDLCWLLASGVRRCLLRTSSEVEWRVGKEKKTRERVRFSKGNGT